MKNLFLLIFVFISGSLSAQTFTVSPDFPKADEPITITVDVTGVGTLEDETEVWLWAFLPDCSSDCDAITNVNPADNSADDAKFTSTGTANEYTLTFTPTKIFNKSASEITRIGYLVKARDFSGGQTADQFINISSGNLEVAFTQPTSAYQFVNSGQVINISAASSANALLSLSINGTEVSSTNGTAINYNHTVTETGTVEVIITANDGSNTASDSFYFIVREATPTVTIPTGVQKGINYTSDDTKVILSLEAPGKNSVYVIGEFNDWIPGSAYQMNKDGDLFWLEISGLVSGTEYAFQYLVDEDIVVPDPYADKVLDPDNDAFIPAATYPDLKSYPAEAEGIVSVLQTGQAAYNWQVTDFNAPAKEDLVIYELLVRDFEDAQNYQSIIDRLDYIEGLGVNAIELMPIMEFDGNLSWGYNPSFFFAPDKYYGSKNALKEFIDECHKRGMAVILDMVLNHTHEDNPIAQLYWNDADFVPAADNPWLNVVPRHPFNVFYDFNHESPYTQNFVDTVNHYWLEEYKFDGYRFDLTKGFTQDFTEGSDVGAWSSYNQKRIDLLKRMVDAIWVDHPDAHIIFEHLGANSEEKVLADYGIMMWGNMNHNYNQLTLGYSDDSNIEWSYHGTRNWNDPNLIAYMESHDEERLVYRNLEFGNTSNGGHNTKNLNVALERVKAASAIYYTIPGPKMIWQFGELGYDKSIELNGRTGEKPAPWASSADGLAYNEDTDRLRLYNLTGALADLKTSYDIFNSSDFTLDQSQSLIKQVTLKNQPYTATPTDPSQMNVVVVCNFNVTNQNVSATFPHDGNWYHYFANGDELVVSGGSEELSMSPGEFRIYTDVKLNAVASELTNHVQPNAPISLTASEVANQGVQLSWSDESVIETSYKIYRGSDSGNLNEIASVSSNSETFIDESAEPNTDYSYAVYASNQQYKTQSNVVSISTSNLITSLELIAGEGNVVFPNPTDGKIYVKGFQAKDEVYVYSITGELLKEERLSEDHTLNISDLKAGIYFIKVSGGKSSIVNRIIKN
ncbi:T9SS type A sorting domain-containing protein [Fulvivirga sp. RKSG066]|uniref:alpha-amylase family glycosyl hydrolase n=1 Tax=Fulvivirga aurantia TaxID=2529383 RepID=UPI0012BCE3ED|nr:alpha-amylase family glycosyl hydrolase [Fulvivirga aurantia]MTI21042.1 T9SS type A sorting domain-containing protein [Fulvivirga aurantia]